MVHLNCIFKIPIWLKSARTDLNTRNEWLEGRYLRVCVVFLVPMQVEPRDLTLSADILDMLRKVISEMNITPVPKVREHKNTTAQGHSPLICP